MKIAGQFRVPNANSHRTSETDDALISFELTISKIPDGDDFWYIFVKTLAQANLYQWMLSLNMCKAFGVMTDTMISPPNSVVLHLTFCF